MELCGKTAIVTGGAVRLGRAIALALANAGVRIVLHSFRSGSEAEQTRNEIRALGSQAVTIQADLSRPLESARTIIKQARDEFGTVDILINNAAIFQDSCLAEVSGDEWDRSFAVNLKSPFFLCREFAAQRRPRQRRHIVNIADRRAMRPGRGYLVYTLTKSGLISLTQNLALELAPDVQVNAIAPGAILPPPGRDDNYLHELAQKIPLRRTGSPQEVTEAVLYLLRSDFMTGAVLPVAGGEQL